MIKSYRQLIRIPSFEDRYEYLRIGGIPGRETFGFDRYLNQLIYHSGRWKNLRRDLIVRDNGCDLAYPGRDIFTGLILHHINSITIDDVEQDRDCIWDPDNLVCVMDSTHKAIHFGDAANLRILPPARREGDTDLWTASSRRLKNF